VLARQTNGQNVAIIQLGSTLPSTTPPTRIAEEYAMLDCISGGRLVAGFPTGLPTDATISNAVVPVEQRERYREALALVKKAHGAHDARVRHEAIDVLVVLVGAQPVQAGLGRKQHLVERRVVELADPVGIGDIEPDRIDISRIVPPLEIGRQVSIRHQVEHAEFHCKPRSTMRDARGRPPRL
jgi:hypothetical protein